VEHLLDIGATKPLYQANLEGDLVEPTYGHATAGRSVNRSLPAVAASLNKVSERADESDSDAASERRHGTNTPVTWSGPWRVANIEAVLSTESH
jgi:hypothetical protein